MNVDQSTVSITQLGIVKFEQREIDFINGEILKFSTVKISLYGNFHAFPLCYILWIS